MSKKPTKYKAKSKISNAGNGLFAKKIFYKGDIVCEYFGMLIGKEELYKSYNKDSDNYLKKIHPFTRNFDNTRIVIGTENKDLDKCGVLINDAKRLMTDKMTDMQKYVTESMRFANVDIVVKDGKMYYVALKRIKKNQEFYSHYGIGYWLLWNGIEPQMIAIMHRDMGGFDRFYNKK